MKEPDFQKSGGLVPVITQDSRTLEVLMLGYMNKEAWEETLTTGRACYFSRSRKKLWRKGEESGNVQNVEEIRIDCDQDTVLLRVEQIGEAACHTGRRSCFYRVLQDGEWVIDSPRIFDPEWVYRSKKK